jgi:beta-glucanase (GH16 family)
VPNQVVGTGHWGSNNSNYGKDYTFPTGQDFTGWHVYSIEWNSTSINWYVDDAPFYVTLSPMDACFTKAFYFILNLAVGGNFDGMKAPAANMPNQQALVDWVRVYQLQ